MFPPWVSVLWGEGPRCLHRAAGLPGQSSWPPGHTGRRGQSVCQPFCAPAVLPYWWTSPWDTGGRCPCLSAWCASTSRSGTAPQGGRGWALSPCSLCTRDRSPSWTSSPPAAGHVWTGILKFVILANPQNILEPLEWEDEGLQNKKNNREGFKNSCSVN